MSVYVFYVFMHISYFRFLFTSLIYLDVFSFATHICICKTFIKWVLHSIQCDTLALQIICTEVCSSRFKSEPSM